MTIEQKADAVEPVATVVVVGGGITGLSAAHELMERGFRVYVVEKAAGLDRTGARAMALGGLARTQYAFAPWVRDPSAMRTKKGDCPAKPVPRGPLAPEKAPRVWFSYQRSLDIATLLRLVEVAHTAGGDAEASVSTALGALNDALKELIASEEDATVKSALEALIASANTWKSAIQSAAAAPTKLKAIAERTRDEVTASRDKADKVSSDATAATPPAQAAVRVVEDVMVVVRAIKATEENATEVERATVAMRAVEAVTSRAMAAIEAVERAATSPLSASDTVEKAVDTAKADWNTVAEEASAAKALWADLDINEVDKAKVSNGLGAVSVHGKAVSTHVASLMEAATAARAARAAVWRSAEEVSASLTAFHASAGLCLATVVDIATPPKGASKSVIDALSGCKGQFQLALADTATFVEAARGAAVGAILGKSTAETLSEFTSRQVNLYPFPEIKIRVFSNPSDAGIRQSAYALLEAEIRHRYPGAKLEHSLENDDTPIPDCKPIDLGGPTGTPTTRNWAILEMKSSLVPGEHGYRFFPAYYNHLRDLLQRIPILDEMCEPTGRTVFDNLQGSPYMGLASRKGDIAILQRLPGSGFRDRVQNWISTAAFAGTPRDVAQYVNRVLRYMTLCPDRRIELADQSWIEYLIGRDPKRGGPLYCYSDDFMRNLAFAGRVLAALDNRWADARTAGDAFVQLTLSQISPQLKPDGVLNAPTTEAWFDPWRRWLQHGGVEFRQGELTGFTVTSSGTLEPDWAPPKPSFEHPPDYYLLATDLVSTQEIIAKSDKPEAWPLLQSASTIKRESEKAREKHEKSAQECRVRLREINESLHGPLRELHQLEREVDVLRANFRTASDSEKVKIKQKHEIATGAIRAIKDAQGELLRERATKRDELIKAERGVKAGDDAYAGLKKVERFCAQLRAFAQESFDPESNSSRARCPYTELGEEPWDRLQTLSGVQFYFAHLFQVVDGHVYYVDAEWGLSAINQQQFWARRPTLAKDGYVSVMSVDVGSWRVPSRLRGGRDRVDDEIRDAPHATAWDLDERELADEVWRQIRTSLSFRHRPRDHWFNSDDADEAPPNSPGRLPRRLPRPVWFHIDEYLKYEYRGSSPETLEEGRYLTKNEAPYLIPVKRDWRNRPGPNPWDPTVRDDWPRPPVTPVQTTCYWQGKGGGYPILCEKVVFAGTWLKTFTRMTTMESANESARHAVNAILQHRVEHTDAPKMTKSFPFGGTGFPTDDDLRSAGRRVDFGAQEVFSPTPYGDLCRIWDPEFNEADEFLSIRMLDLALFRAGMPPAWDVLGLHELPRHTPDFVDFVDRDRPSDDPSEGARSPLTALQAFSRALGLPGVPMPSSTAYGSMKESSPFGLEAIESLLHQAKLMGTRGAMSDPLELLRQLRTTLEYGNRRGHY